MKSDCLTSLEGFEWFLIFLILYNSVNDNGLRHERVNAQKGGVPRVRIIARMQYYQHAFRIPHFFRFCSFLEAHALPFLFQLIFHRIK